MDITCPHCRQTLEGDSVSPGDDVVCPACNREFSIPRLVALGPDRSGFNSRRAQRKPQLAKRMSFAIVLVGLLAAGGVWVRNELKKHVGQLVPAEYALECDSAERDFLADFSRRYGRGYIDVFLRYYWTKDERLCARTEYVPWACFMERDEQINCRIARLDASYVVACFQFEQERRRLLDEESVALDRKSQERLRRLNEELQEVLRQQNEAAVAANLKAEKAKLKQMQDYTPGDRPDVPELPPTPQPSYQNPNLDYDFTRSRHGYSAHSAWGS